MRTVNRVSKQLPLQSEPLQLTSEKLDRTLLLACLQPTHSVLRLGLSLNLNTHNWSDVALFTYLHSFRSHIIKEIRTTAISSTNLKTMFWKILMWVIFGLFWIQTLKSTHHLVIIQCRDRNRCFMTGCSNNTIIIILGETCLYNYFNIICVFVEHCMHKSYDWVV